MFFKRTPWGLKCQNTISHSPPTTPLTTDLNTNQDFWEPSYCRKKFVNKIKRKSVDYSDHKSMDLYMFINCK